MADCTDRDSMAQAVAEGHRQRHIELHAALDELAADWALHQPLGGKVFSTATIMELIEWSHQQTIKPDGPK